MPCPSMQACNDEFIARIPKYFSRRKDTIDRVQERYSYTSLWRVFLSFCVNVKNPRSPDLRLTLGGPLVRNVIRLCVSQ